MAFGFGKDLIEIIISAKDKTAAAFKKVETNMQRMETNAAKVRGAVDKVVGATLLIGGVAAIGAIVGATKVFMDFEQSIANTASVTGATGEELKKLEDAAREMGKTTAFSGSQAADAMYFLGSAGYDTDQVIGSLNGVMQLAGATMSDLAFTSETVVSTLNAFGMEAEDSDRIANVFAATIAGSQATMDKLANTMRYIAPIAHEVGWSFEETTAAAGQLYNAGYRGEEAGTILRGALTRLIAPTGEVKDKLNELGVQLYKMSPELEKASIEFDEQRIELRELKDGYLDLLPAMKEVADEMDEFSDEQAKNRLEIKKIRYEASKEGRELTEAEEAEIERLELANEGLGISYDELAIKQDDMQEEADKLTDAIAIQEFAVADAEKAYAGVPKELKSIVGIMEELEGVELSTADAVTIFGQRAGPGMLSLLSAGSEAVDTFTGDITDTNKAAEMYAIQMDTLTGTFAILKSALEEVGIVMGKTIAPLLTEVADKFRDTIPAIMAFLSKLKDDLQPTFENLKSILESTKGIISDLFTGVETGDFTDVINTVTEIVAKFFKFFDDHPDLVKIIASIGGAIIAWAYIVPTITGIVTGVSGLVALISGAGGLATILPALLAALGGPIGVIVLAIAGLLIAWELNLFGIRDKTQVVVDFLRDKFDFVMDKLGAVKDYLPLLLGPIGAVYLAFENWDKIKEVAGNLKDTISDKFDAMKDKIGDFTSKVQDKLGLTKGELVAMASPAGPIVLFKKAWDTNLLGIQDKVTEAMSVVKDKITDATDMIREKIDGLSDLPGQAYEWGRNLVQSFIDGITGMLDSLIAKVEEVASIVTDFIGITSPAKMGPLAKLEEWGPNLVKTFTEGIEKNLPKLNTTFNTMAVPSAVTSIAGSPSSSKTSITHIHIGSVDSQDTADYMIEKIERIMKKGTVI